MSKIQLINADCLEAMKDIPDGSIDMVLTDIPYGEVNRDSNGLRNLDKGKADTTNTLDLEKTVNELIRICRGSLYIFCGTEQVSNIRKLLVNEKLSTRLCIWEKTNPSPMNGQHIWLSGIECCVYAKKKNATFNEHCKNSVFKFPSARSKIHPTQKPVKLMQYLIEASSNEGDTVLDAFMGSGTTGVACKNLNRNFIGIELDETYFNLAKDRINNHVKETN